MFATDWRPTAIALAAALTLTACGSADREFQQYHDKLISVTSTARVITQAWLEGDASARSAENTLRKSYELLQQQKASLERDPELMRDSRGTSLSEQAGRAEREIAMLIQAVRNGDVQSARAGVQDLPANAGGRP